MEDVRDEVAAEDETDSSGGHLHRWGVRRALLYGAVGVLLVALVGLFVLWRSLSGIDRVPFDQESLRDRLETVPDDQVQAFQDQVAAAESAAAEQEAEESEQIVVDDEDLLEGARDALADREISANFEVPFATSPPVDDSQYDAYLLIGSDLSGALADVIMYILKPTNGDAPIMASLPRDLYLPNPCTRTNTRINAALNGCGEFANGPELLGLMVENFTGIPVDHFALVDFEGFADVVDAFGGLEICVDNPVRDAKAFLELDAGCTDADGETVLAWVRSRQTQEFVDGRWQSMEGVSDFSRQEKQQDVLIDIALKLRSFSSITAFRGVVAGLQESLTFDEGLDFASLIDTAWDNRNLDLGAIERIELGFEDYTVPMGEHRAFVLVPTMSFVQALENSDVALDLIDGPS
jgi:LCP family protein required for cell wall assembly